MSHITPFDANLLSKQQAAELLGVSLSTFDRSRERLGLRPVPSARLKPIFFDRAAVAAAKHGTNGMPTTNGLPPARTAKMLLERTALVSLPALRKVARKARANER